MKWGASKTHKPLEGEIIPSAQTVYKALQERQGGYGQGSLGILVPKHLPEVSSQNLGSLADLIIDLGRRGL
jgi:hypothetical protein